MTSNHRTVGLVSLILFAVGCGGSSPAPADASIDSPPPSPASAGTATSEVPPPMQVGARLSRQAKQPPATLERVRELTTRFYAGELDELYREFSPDMQESFSLAQLKALHGEMLTTLGKETELIGEDWQTKPGYTGFVRWANFDKTQDIVQIEWILRDDNQAVAGFFLKSVERPPAASGN